MADRLTDDRADCIVGGIPNRELQACAVLVGKCAVRGPDRPPVTLLEAADVRLIRWSLCGPSAGHEQPGRLLLGPGLFLLFLLLL